MADSLAPLDDHHFEETKPSTSMLERKSDLRKQIAAERDF